jgi:hypothetical protein
MSDMASLLEIEIAAKNRTSNPTNLRKSRVCNKQCLSTSRVYPRNQEQNHLGRRLGSRYVNVLVEVQPPKNQAYQLNLKAR